MRKNRKKFSTVKVTLRINKEINERIREEASRRGVTQQSIIMTALKDRYDPDIQLANDAMVAERLNRVDRQLRAVLDSCTVIAESQSFFVRMWLTNNPEVPADQRDRAVASAKIRYEKYVKAVTNALGGASLKPWDDVTEVTTAEQMFQCQLLKPA